MVYCGTELVIHRVKNVSFYPDFPLLSSQAATTTAKDYPAGYVVHLPSVFVVWLCALKGVVRCLGFESPRQHRLNKQN
jgi:hypothetical protein